MKCKKTVNVKKFVSILLCTIFMSSILPSNLLNCTVFATDSTYKKEQIFDGGDLIYNLYQKGNTFSRIYSKIDNTEKDLAKDTDYTIEECEDEVTKEKMFKVTIKKEYIITNLITTDKHYTLYFCVKPFPNDADASKYEDKVEMQMYVPEKRDYPICLIEPKYIDHDSNVNERKIYLNSKKDYGSKAIVAHGKRNCTIKIKTKENKTIGNGIVPGNTLECDIELNDEFKKLENGEYPVSIYECTSSGTNSSETNSSGTNSSETNSSETKKLDATFCILNTPPVITFFKNNNEIKSNYEVFQYSLDDLKIKAKDALDNEIEEGNLEIFVKEDKKADKDELNNSENWKLFNGLWDLIRAKGDNQKTIYIYVKAKDKAGNIDIKGFTALLFTKTTTQ